MERPADLDICSHSEIFRAVPPQVLAGILNSSSRKILDAGTALIQQGDPATTVYLVLTGRLRVTQTTVDGQQITIRYLGAGEIVGYMAICGGESNPSTVTALDGCELLAWSGHAMIEIMTQHPQVALNAVSVLGRRYYDIQVRLRELSTENVERRLAHALLRLAQQAGRRTARGIEIAFPLSRQELAEMTGTTLHTASRTLSGWEERGIIDSGRRRIVVQKPCSLSSIADQE
jgi:CRP-like cAMP-binding protein